jgi:hypothetical protein
MAGSFNERERSGSGYVGKILCHQSIHVDIQRRSTDAERQRIIAIIEGLIGPAVTDVGSLRNEAFADAIAAIKEHR